MAALSQMKVHVVHICWVVVGLDENIHFAYLTNQRTTRLILYEFRKGLAACWLKF